MTHERLEELHDEAVLAAYASEIRFEPPDEHEKFTRIYVEFTQEIREELIQKLGEFGALEEHYLRGGPHPHDYKLPLNMWEDVTD